MTTPANRSLLPLAALVCALAISAPAAHAARKPLSPGGASLDVGAIMGDPMSPVNPYNSGVDPVTMPNDARIAVFNYSRDQVFKLLTAPVKLTTIELAPGEKLIVDPAMGDSVDWIVDTDGANEVYVKPVRPGLVNTLHLKTNMRTYDFTVISSPAGGLFYQRVRFHYQESLMAKVRAREQAGDGPVDAGTGSATDSGRLGVTPDKLNFDYTVSGSAPFRPETVFDDGKFVWLRLPADAPFAVPIVKDHGDDIAPNFIRRGQYIVVQQLADKIVLRASRDEVTITRGRRGIFGF
ncbi:MAG TPA: TrbG/VirB9 family P-type conjugative transfer protein [Paraburkholderia sp.]|uniref:TrbG/VirB9 family P-type conjugative transfer protein n=1 Tax=Paraburkholderia sp. TaxID=1926495 RepID=UPI002B4946BA|nr:TrbG/VirB9 family P-type conjugative transfer protein [Paraburkholderia sp.]HKR44053.1 TrbG/VirB9 family P-type conjugative transfer protein [Paraburkholderia sp.]